MVGIYKITKKENGKCYIGQSNDIQKRISEHKTKGTSRGRTYKNLPIYKKKEKRWINI